MLGGDIAPPGAVVEGDIEVVFTPGHRVYPFAMIESLPRAQRVCRNDARWLGCRCHGCCEVEAEETGFVRSRTSEGGVGGGADIAGVEGDIKSEVVIVDRVAVTVAEPRDAESAVGLPVQKHSSDGRVAGADLGGDQFQDALGDALFAYRSERQRERGGQPDPRLAAHTCVRHRRRAPAMAPNGAADRTGCLRCLFATGGGPSE